ncbi:hypothetical protein CEXT_427291 [Caerostris extrusa]|uniref:Uncharacterized protein n=1 Tax=Caerostris extrusa TaxID=172846 RepID=A0AAV4VQ73_CAEEX|nr:hypothetical protein CEXT_427291 [Caerostris extrusa]
MKRNVLHRHQNFAEAEEGIFWKGRQWNEKTINHQLNQFRLFHLPKHERLSCPLAARFCWGTLEKSGERRNRGSIHVRILVPLARDTHGLAFIRVLLILHICIIRVHLGGSSVIPLMASHDNQANSTFCIMSNEDKCSTSPSELAEAEKGNFRRKLFVHLQLDAAGDFESLEKDEEGQHSCENFTPAYMRHAWIWQRLFIVSSSFYILALFVRTSIHYTSDATFSNPDIKLNLNPSLQRDHISFLFMTSHDNQANSTFCIMSNEEKCITSPSELCTETEEGISEGKAVE